MNHWLLDSITDKRCLALREADRVQLCREKSLKTSVNEAETLQDVVFVLELAVLDMELGHFVDDAACLGVRCQAAEDAFRLWRVLPLPCDSIKAAIQVLRASALAVIGDCGEEAERWLQDLKNAETFPVLSLDSTSWGERCRAVLLDIWLRLVCRKRSSERDVVLEKVAALRNDQQKYERDYLSSFGSLEAKRSALELIAIYHLIKAAEVLIHHYTDSEMEDGDQIQSVLSLHFGHAVKAYDAGQLYDLGSLARLLACASCANVDKSL